MVAKFNPRVPKRGLRRSIEKRPASKKNRAWHRTPYVRDPKAAPTIRGDRDKWKRSVADILKGNPSSLISMLRADGLLPSWEGKQCPRCHRGTLSKAVPEKRGGELPKHRCNAKKCQTYINIHHGHPLFVESQGGATPLATQAALLLLLLNRVPHAAVHRLLHVNHKVIEDMEKRLCQLRQSWVLQQEKLIRFGADQAWADVEADEATFDKKVINKQVQWEQWCGLVQRGKPNTLVLHRLHPVLAQLRAPGPGAIRKVEWQPLAKKWLGDRRVVLHTASAKSYCTRVPGVLHDRVVHKKQRVKIAGKFKWIAPKYVELKRHRLPGTKKVLQVKSGTQIIDRCWKFLKDRLGINQSCRVSSMHLRMKLRSAQYEYWLRGKDLWIHSGTLVQWFMSR